MLAADSLLPEGHGQGLSAGDVSVLWEIAQALGKALDAAAGVKKCVEELGLCLCAGHLPHKHGMHVWKSSARWQLVSELRSSSSAG